MYLCTMRTGKRLSKMLAGIALKQRNEHNRPASHQVRNKATGRAASSVDRVGGRRDMRIERKRVLCAYSARRHETPAVFCDSKP